MSSTIISTGTTFRIYDQSVTTYSKLPAKTFRVAFSQLEGFSLQEIEDLSIGEQKVYGSHERRMEKIQSTYSRLDRSLGVLLSGDKGMGKSLMLRLIAVRMGRSEQLPVILVDAAYPGVASFIDSIGESIVVFDEFEKVFQGEDGSQNQFLPLFDGMSSTKRLYLVSVNRLERVSDYFVNRPGRFHYHIRFDYPTPDEVEEYLTDQGISPELIRETVEFSGKTKINYDHLRSIALELQGGGDFKEMIADLNIKRVDDYSMYRITVHFEDGTTITDTDHVAMFGVQAKNEGVGLRENGREFSFRFDATKIDFRDGELQLPGDLMTPTRTRRAGWEAELLEEATPESMESDRDSGILVEEDSFIYERPVRAVFEIIGQRSYAY